MTKLELEEQLATAQEKYEEVHDLATKLALDKVDLKRRLDKETALTEELRGKLNRLRNSIGHLQDGLEERQDSIDTVCAFLTNYFARHTLYMPVVSDSEYDEDASSLSSPFTGLIQEEVVALAGSLTGVMVAVSNVEGIQYLAAQRRSAERGDDSGRCDHGAAKSS